MDVVLSGGPDDGNDIRRAREIFKRGGNRRCVHHNVVGEGRRLGESRVHADTHYNQTKGCDPKQRPTQGATGAYS